MGGGRNSDMWHAKISLHFRSRRNTMHDSAALEPAPTTRRTNDVDERTAAGRVAVDVVA